MTKDGKIVFCEVGVGPLSMANSFLLADNPNYEILAFEPHPVYYADFVKAVGSRPNVKIHNVAIGDENGEAEFYDNATSSSLVGIETTTKKHDTLNKFSVQVRRISEFDNGEIDILSVDVEGNEFFVLKHLISRPQQITVEIYNDLATYINPYLFEIEEWAKNNDYKRVRVANSDFVYRKI